MLPSFIFFFQGINDHIKMLFISKKISITYVNEQCFEIVLLNVMSISFLDIKKIFIRDVLFVKPSSLADILLQFYYGRMQIN